MASTTKLIVWNAALRELGAAPLADPTSANTRQFELNASWDHAIEHTLALEDWNFARRRSNLVGVADTSFPPYTHRLAKPADYLRMCWLKLSAVNEYQLDNADIAAAIYAFESAALLEYISDHADNYEPANWPPHFTRVLTLYLASLVAPKLARAGADDLGRLNGQMQTALGDAKAFEARFLTNVSLASNRQPVFRKALEFLGHAIAGSLPIHAQADQLRWSMNRAWDHSVRYVLEQHAWNFATKRARMTDGLDADDVVPSTDMTGIVPDYSYGTAATTTDTTLPSISGYTYAWALPDDFLHKIWIKATADADREVSHQIMGDYIFTNVDTVILEYIAETELTTNPDNWSAVFLEAVAAYLALNAAPELILSQDSKGRAKVDTNMIKGKLEGVWRSKLFDAELRDAIQQMPYPLPRGRFMRARGG